MSGWIWLAVAETLIVNGPVQAQAPADNYEFLRVQPVMPRGWYPSSTSADVPACSHFSSVPLFRMPTALPASPLGLDTSDDVPPDLPVLRHCSKCSG